MTDLSLRRPRRPRSRGRSTTAVLISMLLMAIATLSLMASPASAAASSGCQFRGATKPAPVKTTAAAYASADTWLYGDSITWQTYRNLGLKRVAVDAYWGRNTASAMAALRKDFLANKKNLPKTVVMAVGTNDLQNLSTFKQQVANVRAMLPKSVRLVWVNVYVDTNPAYAQANSLLSSVAGVTIVSWSAANLPYLVDGKSTLLYDGVHVNETGCVVRNQAIRRVVGTN